MLTFCAPQLSVLDAVLKEVMSPADQVTSPADQASETQPQEGEGSLGSANLVEQLDTEEPEHSKLPQYLERFKVIQSRS